MGCEPGSWPDAEMVRACYARGAAASPSVGDVGACSAYITHIRGLWGGALGAPGGTRMAAYRLGGERFLVGHEGIHPMRESCVPIERLELDGRLTRARRPVKIRKGVGGRLAIG